MKIDFCVELGTNIEFHECFIMMAGIDMTFINKKCHAELNFIIFIFSKRNSLIRKTNQRYWIEFVMLMSWIHIFFFL